MTIPGQSLLRIWACICACAWFCLSAHAQYETDIAPPSNLPSNTPAAYNLIVPVVGQQESNWCWAASSQMVDNYVDPLPVVQQCKEANAMFNPNGPEPQPCPNTNVPGGCTTLPTANNPQTCLVAWSDCCSSGTSCSCNVGNGGSSVQFPFDYYGNSTGTTLTWDQLRYQIWANNEPVTFAWNWCPCPQPSNCCGAHVMVVTGYETDSQGNQWVYVNNPEPVGQGDFECMSYDEWSQDTSNGDPFGAHTHQGDWFDSSYAGTQLINNLATNSVVPVTALSEAQAQNLAGTVISDRNVPIQVSGSFFGLPATTGTVQERVVQESGSGTLDFYYHITNAPSSGGNITQLTLKNFGRATVAPAWRPDSLGTYAALQASRDVTGSNINIYLQPIPPGGSSHFILLMTDATSSNDQGTMQVNAESQLFGLVTFNGTAQIATDQPTAIPMTTANMSACPVMSQPTTLAAVPQAAPEISTGLPRRLEAVVSENARKTATAALPHDSSKATVDTPIQLAEVRLNDIAAYEAGREVASIVRPLTGLIVPAHVGDQYTGIFLKEQNSRYVPVGMGQPNMTRLIVRAREAVARQNNVAVESLTVLRIPSLFLTFIARPVGNQIRLTPVSDEPSYELKSGQEITAESLLTRLRPAALRYHTSGFSAPTRKASNQIIPRD